MSSINNDNNTTRQEPAAAQTPDAAASTTTRKEAFRRFHAEISAPSRRAAAQRSSQTAAARTATRKTPPLRPPRPPPAPSSSPASSAAAAASAAANANAAVSTSTAPPPPPASLATEPTIEAYIGRLERFELFSTNQCYYIVGSNKLNTAYRIIKIDRTLIERAPEQHQSSAVNTQAATSFSSSSAAASPPSGGGGGGGGGSTHNNNIINMRVVGMSRGDSNISTNSGATIPGSASGGGGPNSGPNNSGSSDNNVQASEMAENSHTAKPTLRPLSDFLTEDPNVYTQEEIKDVLDMIHDGNRMTTNTNTRSGGGNSGMDRLMQDNSNSSNNNNSNSNIGSAGGLKPIVKAYGLVGFIRFLDCYYLTLITKRAKVGSIGCGCGVYTIKNTETIPLKPAERVSTELVDDLDPSSVLLSMWNRGKRSVGLGLSNREIAELRYQGLYQVVDLSKSFFFSYTYDLTRSLQENFLAASTQPFPPPPFKDIYAWNFFLTREFEGCLHSLTSYHWITPIVHGAFVQKKLSDYGRSLNLILLARRSRHFAGTRYLKRGVSEQGKVANDVEHEQILHDESSASKVGGTFSSYLQVRGSIPTFWTQESSVTMPKPPIELNRVDPTYTATQLHFEDLLKRYASPILVVDLVKQSEKREREVRVGNEFRHAVDYINNSINDDHHKIRYLAFDYSTISKHRHLDVSSALNEVSTWAVNATGFFCSSPRWKMVEGGLMEPFTEEDGQAAANLSKQLGVPVFPMEQSGVLRTNCIDCLDRTNVAQFSAGVAAISQQLVVMGIRSQSHLDSSSNVVRVLIDMYVDIGDSIALQYGGSEAHKKVTAGKSESNIMPIGKHKELLTSIRRYYSNAFTDRLKQDAINLFLGYYVPYHHSSPLWEMETDYYLHNLNVKAGKGTTCSMRTYRRAFGIDWNEVDMDGESDITSYTASQSNDPSAWEEKDDFDTLHQQHQIRLLKVRNRVRAQNDALSAWWKAALHSNIQQRMWMKLGRRQSETFLPQRYERLYQPDKIAQFDRFFARGWATPVRRSHSAQHTEGPEDDSNINKLTRCISTASSSFLKNANASEEKLASEELHTQSLGQYIGEHGFSPSRPVSLRMFVDHHGGGGGDNVASYLDFVGLDNGRATPSEYERYCTPSCDLYKTPHSHREGAADEFRRSLHEVSLDADDVSGIRQLSESAHLSRVIQSGPYRGFDKDKSAIEIATALHEQFIPIDSTSNGSPGMVELELTRRGLASAGVRESIANTWHGLKRSEQEYLEILSSPMERCSRSDLTTASAFKQYASAFDESTPLFTPDVIFLNEQPSSSMPLPSRPPESMRAMSRPAESAFVKKAAELGYDISPYSDTSTDSVASLFPRSGRQSVPAGFEQINDDMFARKDNIFMVFNSAALHSWHGAQPVTKKFEAEHVLLGE